VCLIVPFKIYLHTYQIAAHFVTMVKQYYSLLFVNPVYITSTNTKSNYSTD